MAPLFSAFKKNSHIINKPRCQIPNIKKEKKKTPKVGLGGKNEQRIKMKVGLCGKNEQSQL